MAWHIQLIHIDLEELKSSIHPCNLLQDDKAVELPYIMDMGVLVPDTSFGSCLINDVKAVYPVWVILKCNVQSRKVIQILVSFESATRPTTDHRMTLVVGDLFEGPMNNVSHSVVVYQVGILK